MDADRERARAVNRLLAAANAWSQARGNDGDTLTGSPSVLAAAVANYRPHRDEWDVARGDFLAAYPTPEVMEAALHGRLSGPQRVLPALP